MASRRLTTKFVESVAAPAEGQAAYPDAQVPGLELRVSSKGRKVWSLRYRTKVGRQRRVTLGTFPAVDLGDAREGALVALAAVAAGGDPAAEQRKQKAAEANIKVRTFGDLADEYLKACEAGTWKPKNKRKRGSTISTEKNVLKLHIRPRLGRVELQDITRRHVRSALTEMVKAGLGARANKAHAIIRQVFAFGISEEVVDANPAAGLPPPAEQRARARILTDTELRTWWSALETVPDALRLPTKQGQEEGDLVTVGRPMRIALQLATLLLQRRGEIAGMAASELNLEQGTWLIPAERTKAGKPHLVPLPPRAVELIEEALRLAKAGREKAPAWVFPARHKEPRAMRPDSMTHAMAELTRALGIKNATPHDLRRTGSTVMTSERLKVSPFIRSKVLGHSSDTGGGAAVSSAHYDLNTYAGEKRQALEAWERLLLQIVGEVSPGVNVVDLRQRAG